MPSSESHSVPTWAGARDKALERLVKETRPREFYGFREQLLETCAEIVARSRGNTLVFLGRSLENAYDLLRALLRGVRGAPPLRMLPFSLRTGTTGTAARMARFQTERVEGLGKHLDSLGLGPEAIAAHPRGITFVDCVAWGTTFGNLDEMLRVLAVRQGVIPRSVAHKVQYLGLVRESVGWTHWRNDEECGGARLFRQGRAEAIPISTRLWFHCAGERPKTMDSYGPDSWTQPPRLPPLDDERGRAISLSVELMSFGWSRDVRRAFAGKLSRRIKKKDGRWLGSLVVGVLKKTQLRRFNR